MLAGRSACASCAPSSTSSKATGTFAPEQHRAAGAGSLGILGGTFNPPHLGHVAVAECAREQLGLERVLLMPVHSPPHKQQGVADPGAEHRLAMCRLAVAGAHGLRACALEVERGGTSYTVDTLDAMQASHPEVGLTLIMGADTAATLRLWRDPQRIVELARLGIAGRGASGRRQALDAIREIGGEGAARRAGFLEMEEIEVSSSQVRALAARGEPLQRLVGEGVARYIAEHRLYGSPARAGA